MDWMSVKKSFFDVKTYSFLVMLTHNICCNRWQRNVLPYVYWKDFTLFTCLIDIFTLFFSTFLSFHYCFLFIYYYYESVGLFGKKGIPLIDASQMYPRMLRIDEVCKHSYIFSRPSIQPAHECFVITEVVNFFYGPYSLLSIYDMWVE